MLAGWLVASSVWAAPTILVWGDSLSAGYGVDTRSGWVVLLEQKLRTQDDVSLKNWTVVNGSVSGETTAGGLARLPAALARHKPDVVLLELGANDGLRGLDLKQMRLNLEKMIDLVTAIGARPVLFEMRIPNNYGPLFTERFRRSFADTASAKQASFMPFFLSSIAEDRPRWFQEDGIHPRTEAQPLILATVWPQLVPMLKEIAASSVASRP